MSEARAAATAGLRPPLKWAGGKRWLVPALRAAWMPHATRRLVEPFCGGLAVTLALDPRRALVADVNPHLVNFYRWLQLGLRLPFPPRNEESAYYAARDRFNELLAEGKTNTAEAAALFYYLNRTGFNGLCRFNRAGLYNVPFGRHATINYVQDFTSWRQALAGWKLRCGDFESTPLEADDFVYADPPYDVPFRQYSQGGFEWSDQERLANWLARHAGPVALSNQATDRVVALYDRLGFQLQFLGAPRRIACTGDRTPAREVLATRNL